MPFVLRQVTPIALCNRPISGTVDDELQAVSNQALCGILRQLSSLVLHADGILGELMVQFQRLSVRTEAIQTRVQTLKLNCDGLDARSALVPESDLTTFSRQKFQPILSTTETTSLFTEQTRPPALQKLYSACQLNPVVTLRHLDPFRRDGMRSSRLFKCTPIMEKDSSASLLDIETRTPEELDLLPEWIPPSDILHPVHPDVRCNKPNSSNQPLLRKLPTPSQLSVARSRMSRAELVPTDTSGKTFQRLVQFRRSLSQISYTKQKHRRKSRKPRQKLDDSENMTAESTEKSFETDVLLKCDTPTSTDSTNGNASANTKTRPGRSCRSRGDTDSGRGSRTSHRASSDPDSARHRVTASLTDTPHHRVISSHGEPLGPAEDTDDASSAFSCDAEGYYTSFHCDSGVKLIDTNGDQIHARGDGAGGDGKKKSTRKTPPPLPPLRSETTFLSSAIEKLSCHEEVHTPEPATDDTFPSEGNDNEHTDHVTSVDNEEICDDTALDVATPLSRRHGNPSDDHQNKENNIFLTPSSSTNRPGTFGSIENWPCSRSLTAPRPVPPPPRGRLFSSLDRRVTRHTHHSPHELKTVQSRVPPNQSSVSRPVSSSISECDPAEGGGHCPGRATQQYQFPARRRYDFPPPPVSLGMDLSPTSSAEDWPYEGLVDTASNDTSKFRELTSFLRASSPRDTTILDSGHILENNFLKLKELSLQRMPDMSDNGVLARLGFNSDSPPTIEKAVDFNSKSSRTSFRRRASLRLPLRSWRMSSGLPFNQQHTDTHSRTDEQKLHSLKSLKFWSLKRSRKSTLPRSDEDSDDDGGFKEYRESAERSLRESSDSYSGPSTPLTDISFSSFSEVGLLTPTRWNDSGSRFSLNMSSSCCLTSTPNREYGCQRIFSPNCKTTPTEYSHPCENNTRALASTLPHLPLGYHSNHDAVSLDWRCGRNNYNGTACQNNVMRHNHNSTCDGELVVVSNSSSEPPGQKNSPIYPTYTPTDFSCTQYRNTSRTDQLARQSTHTRGNTASPLHSPRTQLPATTHLSTPLSQFKAMVASKKIAPTRTSAVDRLLSGKVQSKEIQSYGDPLALTRSLSLPTRTRGRRLSLHRTNIIDTTIPESDEEFQQYSPD